MKPFLNHDGTHRAIQDMQGKKWHVHGIITSGEAGFERHIVQVNICPADGRPVRPERGVKMPQHIADRWVRGEVKVHLA